MGREVIDRIVKEQLLPMIANHSIAHQFALEEITVALEMAYEDGRIDGYEAGYDEAKMISPRVDID